MEIQLFQNAKNKNQRPHLQYLEMDSVKISPELVEASVKKLKTYFANRKKPRQTSSCSYKMSLYDLAKENETKTRNLREAFNLYIEAAINGEKVNSCIKDCASVLHQSGLTSEAVKFLQEMRVHYQGDGKKYEKLIQNLQSQLKPTGKHEYTSVLIDLVDIRLDNPQSQVREMFGNFSRVKELRFFTNLGFTVQTETGRYVVLSFDSFSAAKKTVQTFKDDQWFGVNKFWLDTQRNIVAECNDIKNDFQTGLLFTRSKIQKVNGKKIGEQDEPLIRLIRSEVPRFETIYGYRGLELKNQTSKYLIQNASRLFKMM